ncbi:MAG: BatA and WFA domain-containing protein [Clostridia bacterium]|nr:BatA and WFA domain-containing protein [Clostridia bacterium]
MTLLTPLGLLGLLGIAVLILIYILRPNYQQKFVSSTFVWKLSLKYKKKRIPFSKLRNILLFICQVLILTACALVLAQPNRVLKAEVEETEVIAIIDSSVSMRTSTGGKTRFQRAINGVKELTDGVFTNGGFVSVIVANEAPYMLAYRSTSEKTEAVFDELDNLTCSYGEANVNGAIAMCEEIIEENPKAKIYLYSDAEYEYMPEEIELKNVAVDGEWNAAIVDAYSEKNEGYYEFVVELGCYGNIATEIDVKVNVYEANASTKKPQGDDFEFVLEDVQCDGINTSKVLFISAALYDPSLHDELYDEIYQISETERVFSYKRVHVSLETEQTDCLAQDNSFDIYNGYTRSLRVQYASGLPNNFFPGILYTLETAYQDKWDLDIIEVRQGAEPALEGFDLYIFEHVMPTKMPSDGVVFLVNPENAEGIPAGAGFRVASIVDFRKTSNILYSDSQHSLMKNIDASEITVSKYVRIVPTNEDEYTTLMYYYDKDPDKRDPIWLVKNEASDGVEATGKVMIMNFSLHYSNLAILKEFPLMMYNVMEYFFPVTVDGNSFEVNEKVALAARGDSLTVSGIEAPITEFPTNLTLSAPGTYTLTQTVFGEKLEDKIYVRIPASESNIVAVLEGLDDPYRPASTEDYLEDLLLALSIALVALIFIEWWLQSRENM